MFAKREVEEQRRGGRLVGGQLTGNRAMSVRERGVLARQATVTVRGVHRFAVAHSQVRSMRSRGYSGAANGREGLDAPAARDHEWAPGLQTADPRGCAAV